MNSIKNTIVTVTLLAVAYGAYVVLNSPPPGELGEAPAGVLADIPEDAVAVHVPDSADSITHSVVPGSESQYPATETADAAYPQTSNPYAFDEPAATTAETYQQAPLPIGVPGNAPVEQTTNPGPATASGVASEWPSAPAANDVSDWPTQPPVDTTFPSEGQTADTSTYSTTIESTPPSSPVVLDSAPNGVAAGGNPGFEEAWKAIHSNLANSQLSDALFALTVWYDEPSLSEEQSQRCIRLLDQLAGTVIYSRESFLEPAHVVQEGETLQALSDRYNVPIELLARINGIDAPYDLYPGESLKVVRGPFRAEISRTRNEVTVFLGRYYAGRFSARLGTELPTGPSVYEVIAKDSGREFFDRRSGYRVARDDPSNPYGNVWIGLRGEQVTAAHNVGIHVDTGSQEILCVGVSPDDARDLNAILSVGSRVSVKD